MEVSFGMMDESIYPETTHSMEKSLPDLMIVLWLDIQALKKPRNLYYESSGGQR